MGQYNPREYQYTRINTAASTAIFTGRGNLGGVCINGTTNVGAVQVIDGTSTLVGIIGTSVIAGTYLEGIVISAGLTIVTTSGAGTPDVTIKWTKG